MKKNYLLILFVTMSLNIVSAQQKPLIILEGKEFIGAINELNQDSIADIQRFKGALVEYLYNGAESATVILLKNDFPKSLGVDIPKSYLDKCTGVVTLPGNQTLHKFQAGQARMLLSLIPPQYIDYIEVVRLNPYSRKYKIKERADSVFKITLKTDSTKIHNGNKNTIAFFDFCEPAFRKGETLQHFKKWFINDIYQYMQGKAIHYQNTDGIALVNFCVMPDGKIDEIEITQSTNKKLHEIVIRSLKSAPKWIPATNNGKPMKINYSIPIIFKTPQ